LRSASGRTSSSHRRTLKPPTFFSPAVIATPPTTSSKPWRKSPRRCCLPAVSKLVSSTGLRSSSSVSPATMNGQQDYFRLSAIPRTPPRSAIRRPAVVFRLTRLQTRCGATPRHFATSSRWLENNFSVRRPVPELSHPVGPRPPRSDPAFASRTRVRSSSSPHRAAITRAGQRLRAGTRGLTFLL